MSTILDEPTPQSATSSSQRLRTTMAAVRVSLQWLGVRKTLTPEQRNQPDASCRWRDPQLTTPPST